MLVLSRKKNESVRIGHDGEITVTLVELRGDKVRLGISAPKDVPIHRQEIWEAIYGTRPGGQQEALKRHEAVPGTAA